MSESQDPQEQRNDYEIWDSRIVPTVRALERFFWNVVWFAVIVFVLFSYNPFR